MSGRRLIFWDFHGTLSHRPGGWRGAIAEVLTRNEPALAVDEEDLRPYLRGGFPWDAPDRSYTHLCDPDVWWRALTPMFVDALVGLGVAPARATELIPLVRASYVRPSAHVLFDDALPTLRLLRRLGWRHAVLSNHVPELPEIARHLGLDRYLDGVITSARVGYEKPHPGIFRFAFEAMGVDPSADDLWMIGDNYDADVLGAEGVRLRAVLVRQACPGTRWFSQDLAGVVPIIEGEGP